MKATTPPISSRSANTRPSADQEYADNLELSAQIHQEVHREFEAEDSHVKLEHMLDAFVVSPVVSGVAGDPLDDTDAKLPYDLDTRASAAVHRSLHERHEDELGNEQRECRGCHPNLDMDHVG